MRMWLRRPGIESIRPDPRKRYNDSTLVPRSGPRLREARPRRRAHDQHRFLLEAALVLVGDLDHALALLGGVDVDQIDRARIFLFDLAAVAAPLALGLIHGEPGGKTRRHHLG